MRAVILTSMKLALPLLLFLTPLSGVERSSALYYSLEPTSLTQAAAFYELYPHTPEGKRALARLGSLLKAEVLPLDLLVGALHRFPPAAQKVLSREEIEIVESLSKSLKNRELSGYYAESKEDILNLPSAEIDLSQALLIDQIKNLEERRSYLALLDLMALQVLARLPPEATAEKMVAEMNHFIFEEMRFRFPPHSTYAKNIDTFTFLPSVMDNHIGVCLGVTTLYLTIAQRIGLPLEIITPPGHIFVRYKGEGKVINIETTARGIHLPEEHYESFHLKKKLQPRTMRETIGMTFVNEASIRWEDGDFEKGVVAYEKALLYLDDPFIKELLAFSYILSGQEDRGEQLLASLPELTESGEDFLAKKVDKEGIRALFSRVDEHRATILAKLEKLKGVAQKFPTFRSGLEQVAVCYLQLHRPKEAIEWLLKYHALDPTSPLIEFYLAVLHAEREDFIQAWKFLKNAEAHVKEIYPEALKELRKELAQLFPEPK